VDQCPTPCPADLVGQPGTLNFFDVLAYINLFTAQDPRADLVAPAGVINFADYLAYLGAFSQGCP
jgi:hypothetical protein